MIPFQAHPDLRIGQIIEVSGTAIRVELDPKIAELSRVIDGRVYGIGQFASIVKIHYGRKVLFAYVRLLRMRSESDDSIGSQPIAPGDDSRILEADLFARGVWRSVEDRLDLVRGVDIYPLPLQSVFLTTAVELEAVFSAAESLAESNTISPLVPIGEYVGGNSAECRANIDKLFGQHCAVLGSTGTGKSCTVAALIHAVLDHQSSDGSAVLRPRIIIIDPHGEYAAAFQGEAKVLRAYAATEGDDIAEPLLLPHWLMSGEELRGLIIGKTEHEATTQNNIIFKALKHARMVSAGIVQRLPDDPVGDQPPELCPEREWKDVSGFDRDKPHRFDWNEFADHIDQVQGRKVGKTENLSATDRKSVDSILDKLNVLRTDPRIRYLMTGSEEATLDSVIHQLVGASPQGETLKIIDISGAPNEIAGTLAAMICRLLFSYKVWQSRNERRSSPILLVCEEAHRYVPDRGEAQYREAQDAVRRIAKEGRKYGLGLMLVSQRPADVESTVLSQCNSWIILRLTNGADQEHVTRFLPDSLTGLTRILSSLSRREAIFVGEAAALPARIRIQELNNDKLPNSSDISFVSGWSGEPQTQAQISVTTERWLRNV